MADERTRGEKVLELHRASVRLGKQLGMTAVETMLASMTTSAAIAVACHFKREAFLELAARLYDVGGEVE